jgi:hypothetical protein
MGLFSRKVEVTFVDDRSSEVLGISKMSPEDLPDSFFPSTTLQLGEANWSVVSAEPMTRTEYERSRRLVVRLLPIEGMDAGELLFSLPTICDPLPVSDGSDADGTEVVLRDDDWRQLELVSTSLRSEVEQDIRAVRLIYEQERSGPGFRKAHVRGLVPNPIAAGAVQFEDIQALAGNRTSRPLRFDGAGRRVSNAFTFSFDEGYVLYGIASGASVEILGLHPAIPPGLGGLRQLAQRCRLLLVDWCRCGLGDPNDESFDRLSSTD